MKRWPTLAATLGVWACSPDASQKQSGDTSNGASKPASATANNSSGGSVDLTGAGAGIQQVVQQTVDFGASDAPMTDQEMASAIADIFLGKVAKWNDPRLATLNPGVKLPAADILVVHRPDGSGTTYIFSDYLSAVSSAWKNAPGKRKDLQWPVGIGGKGNEGVAGQMKQLPNSIGYMELAYAQQNELSTPLVQNAAGQFVAPSAKAATAAAEDAIAKLPPNTDYRVSIVNSGGRTAYPITSFTWLLVYKNQPDAAKAKKLADVIRWALTDGEQYAAPLSYAPLPPSLVARLTPRIDSLTMVGSK